MTVQHPATDTVFSPALSPRERAIIEEERAILAALREHLLRHVPEWRDVSYDEALLELRDELGEASEEEAAQIISQMSSLASLSSHRQRHEDVGGPLDVDSPYFGHLRVRQEGRVRDVLIGSRTLVNGRMPYPIIDWRNAPISRVFYRYREGDEYEEEIAGNTVEGEILAHRKLIILKGRLVRIDCDQGVFQLVGERWEKIDRQRPTLHGGAGTALRPGGLEALQFGVAPAEPAREDKHLQVITGLIDPEQFELITRPESGVVVIDGGAGSGKTTIALHRMAYLAYRDRERFAPQNLLAVVYSKALAAYVSHILPALGVDGVRIEVFDDFVSALRQQHFPGLTASYAPTTPTAVMRFKQHPAALGYLEATVAERADELRHGIAEALDDAPGAEGVLEAWDALADQPLAQRMQRFARWARGRETLPRIGGFAREHWLAAQRLERHFEQQWPALEHPHTVVQALWEEAFLSLERLERVMARLAPGEFPSGHLEEVRDWALRCSSEADEWRAWREQRAGGDGGSAADDDDGAPAAPEAAPAPPRIDREDDVLLLLLYRMLVGHIRSKKRRPLRFRHVTVDEAQDLGPLELRVLIGLAGEPLSVTLAGDTDQRMILHKSFTRWEDVLAQLGLDSTAVAPLEVGYRSTAEIMAFARAVLGPLATERPWHATRQGVPVELLRFTDVGQAVATLAESLRGLMRREPTASVALIARHPARADLYFEGLARAELPALRRVADQDFAFRPGIEVTDIGQVKGLEFDYVVLLDADRETYPDDTASRYLLHIGATRAAHQLWLVACRTPSPLLPDDLATHLL